MDWAIETEELTRRYGRRDAVDRLGLRVERELHIPNFRLELPSRSALSAP